MFNLKEFLNLTYYVSPLDQFLKNWDKEHPTPTSAQAEEAKKYQRIYALRDGSPTPFENSKIPFWDEF